MLCNCYGKKVIYPWPKCGTLALGELSSTLCHGLILQANYLKIVTQHKKSRSKMFIDDIFQNSPQNWAKNCRKPSDVFLTFLFHSPNLYNF